MSAPCRLYTRKQKCSASASMSAKCQLLIPCIGLGVSNFVGWGTTLPSEKEGRPSAVRKAFMALDLLTIAGVAGSALIVLAYFANQQGWLSAENWRYSLANLVGAVLILVSLITAWNLPAAIIEGFWALISVYGLLKHGGWLRRR